MKLRSDNLRRLRQHDEDLAYLAQLTISGLKPLSRYERRLTVEHRQELQALGLHWQVNGRRTEQGGEVEETIFSRSPELVALYCQAFADSPLRQSRELGLLEGYLFGFPPCCVAAYLAKPYAENGLGRDDQAILFHWACAGCSITPLLLPRYRDALALVRGL
ncbi:MAG: hypothetical protein R3B09_24925 [Nannocystaceae bacterium]